MKFEMDKLYDFKKIELNKVKFWQDNEYHLANSEKNKNKKPFSMIIPPPNVTGILHIGHAKNTITLDVVARYKRLKGFDVLYLPATDHAGIATQAKVEARLRSQGIDKYQLGREKFLEESFKWKDEYCSYIHKQWEAIGLSLDYSKERFTLDDDMNEAVNLVFKSLYDQGLIYQGERIINWDTELKTALSNIEVVHKESKGKFYYFKYRFADNKEEYITIATTRPETMFGDTALVFNPKDKRYKHLEGKMVINPANNELIPIVADRYVDIEFGTGIMKCTPAHDPNDFEIGKRHNMKNIVCMNKDGTMNSVCPQIYQNLDRYECRELLVKNIEKDGNLVKIEDIVHQVGHSERTDSVVEPMLSKQWFIKMKPLVDEVLKIQKSKNKTQFLPPRFSKIFNKWLESTEDWCISRQLWWGHRIPVYTNKETNEVICSVKPLDSNLYKQDEDVLDTWFSSALAPFAFLGWPQSKDLLERYYPLSTMITAYDIIFFWVARMAVDGVRFTKKMPFKTVFIHGLVRDELGRKMTKSLGNGIDPIKVCQDFGADALRYSIATTGTPGLDISFSMKNVNFAFTFLTKIWNVCRFLINSLPENYKFGKIDKKNLSINESLLLEKMNKTITSVSKNMDKYELGVAATTLYDFVYDDLCSTYVELIKPVLKNGSEKEKKNVYNVLGLVLKNVLVMLFPYSPFISEEIYSYLPGHKKSIYEEKYPTVEKGIDSNKSEYSSNLIDIIKYLRNFKMENKLGISSKIDLAIYNDQKYISNENLQSTLNSLVFADKIDFYNLTDNLGEGFVQFGNFYVKVLVDTKLVNAAVEKRIEFLKSELERSNKLLSNPNFVEKAKKEKVDLEREKQRKYQEELDSYLKNI